MEDEEGRAGTRWDCWQQDRDPLVCTGWGSGRAAGCNQQG